MNPLPDPPSICQFHSVGAWLEAWVEFEMKKSWPSGHGPRTKIPTGDALYLCGSIGYDAALAPDGTVWINEYIETDEENWRLTTQQERLSFLVHAQRKSYPELILLLPTKPVASVPCHECAGTGLLRISPAVSCSLCGSLGWVYAGGS